MMTLSRLHRPIRAEIVVPREVVPGHGYISEEGVVSAPWCCTGPMQDDGDCECGCCDDFICTICGRTVRIEWPD